MSMYNEDRPSQSRSRWTVKEHKKNIFCDQLLQPIKYREHERFFWFL